MPNFQKLNHGFHSGEISENFNAFCFLENDYLVCIPKHLFLTGVKQKILSDVRIQMSDMC